MGGGSGPVVFRCEQRAVARDWKKGEWSAGTSFERRRGEERGGELAPVLKGEVKNVGTSYEEEQEEYQLRF